MRKNSVDEGAFDVLTAEAAYWIGFLMADGCISNNKNGGLSIIVQLSIRDQAHLQKLKAFLKCEHPISSFINTTSFASSGMCRIAVHSNRLCEALEKYGVVPRKSMTSEAKLVEMNHDFWRGMIDGDGWFRNTDYPTIGFTGSRIIVEQCANFVASITGKRPTLYKNGAIWKIHIWGRNAKDFVSRVYLDATVFLDRKMEAAKKVMSWKWRSPGTWTKYPIPAHDQLRVTP